VELVGDGVGVVAEGPGGEAEDAVAFHPQRVLALHVCPPFAYLRVVGAVHLHVQPPRRPVRIQPPAPAFGVLAVFLMGGRRQAVAAAESGQVDLGE
jgi:hypothetical protein